MQFLRSIVSAVKKAADAVGQKTMALVGGTAAILGLTTSEPASAVSYLDPAASAVVAQVQADAVTVFGYGWTLLGVVFGGLLIMGLFRRVTRKGAGG